MASGLGRNVGDVVSVQGGAAIWVQPIVADECVAATVPTMPVEPSKFQVQPGVVLEMELH
jgi:hypothetical protein